MARYTALRGDPETKLTVLNTDFAGGLNVLYSDDLMRDNEFRFLLNYDLENTGEIRARKGFSKSSALTSVIYQGATTIEHFPIITMENSPVKEIILFKILRNDNNVWRMLSEYETLALYQADKGTEANQIKLFIVAELANGTMKYWFKNYTINLATVDTLTSTGTFPCASRVKHNLVNVTTGEQYGKLFFTSNDMGMIEVDTILDTVKYIGEFTGQTNSAYKPNGIEVRKLGFNVLGDDPLTWIDNNGLTVESIQGVYLTTADRIPLTTVPSGMPLQVNIIYTGNYHDFDILFSEYEDTIEADVVKNVTLSSSGIAVYDIKFKTQPNDEVQINIAFTDEAVLLDDYIDYYSMGSYDTSSKAVETIELGKYNVIQIYDRLVYYSGNEIWFSDINNFGYIPNYNYILLPIENTDEIVKIIFFRTSYIIFTKKKIFKLEGSFESSSLNLSLVNDELGCIAPASVSLIENELFFLSTRGLRSLKSDVFRENLENLKKFDEKVYPVVTTNSYATSIVYKEQYMLFSNLRGENRYVTVRGREYRIPDVLRNYYRTGAFSMDKFGEYPRFIIVENGELFSLMTVDNVAGIYQFGLGYDDFSVKYDCEFETGGFTMGYPMHEKKLKNVIFKLGGDLNEIYVDSYGDGYITNSVGLEPLSKTNDIDLMTARYDLMKERLPSKCRNFAIRMVVRETNELFVQSIGYIFKLGKVREH